VRRLQWVQTHSWDIQLLTVEPTYTKVRLTMDLFEYPEALLYSHHGRKHVYNLPRTPLIEQTMNEVAWQRECNVVHGLSCLVVH
jgi:hypothetical protein